MTREEIKIIARRHHVVRVKLGGSSIKGTVGYVLEHEAMIVAHPTLRPMRVAIVGIESIEVVS